jgi:hypothetical protein
MHRSKRAITAYIRSAGLTITAYIRKCLRHGAPMMRLAKQVARRLLFLGLAGLTLWLLFGRYPPPAITDDLSKLEPEMCSTSYMTVFLTSIVPMNVGSPTDSLATEQIALISQYKPEHRRKLWVLRMPAAYIMQRTCDSGRQNRVGEGDWVQVSQHYGLGFILIDDRVLPVTHSNEAQQKEGIPVFVQLKNALTEPERRHKGNANSDWVIGHVPGRPDQPRCAERVSNIPGLVTFKRIKSDVTSPMDCEGQFYSSGVFARKVGDRSYDIVIGCAVRCQMHSDYEGWTIEFKFDRRHLEQWQIMHDLVTRFVASHTFHLDHATVDQPSESLYDFARRARSSRPRASP